MLSKLKICALLCSCIAIFHSNLAAQSVKPTQATDRMKSLENKKAMAKQSPFKTEFTNIGPTAMGGRIVDVAVNPADPTEFYAAYATGGLWHTTNNGQSFTPIFDNEDVIFIGAVAVHWPGRTIWIGTGEANSSRSTYSGIGVFKSENNGESWTYLGLPESHHIGAIKLHPTNKDIAWVAVTGHLYSPNKDRGVYKTSDGGKKWKKTLYIDENTGAIEMDINPKNPDELYATMWYKTRKAWDFEESGKTSGLYKSTDGGEKWSLLNVAGSGLPSGEGVGRMGVAVFAANPQIVYAIVDNQFHQPDTATRKKDTASYKKEDLKDLTKESFAALNNSKLDTFLKRNRISTKYSSEKLKEQVANGTLKPNVLFDYFYDANENLFNTPIIGAEVYRSNNAGKTWTKTNTKSLPGLYNTYGYYFGRLTVSPVNENKLVIMGVSVELSKDGGKTFDDMNARNVHSDHHSCWINPNRDSHMIIGNDGGVNITYDDGKNWFKVNSVPVGQFYTVTTDNAKPFHVYGGLQDNGVWQGNTTRQRTSDANYDSMQYRMIGGGDGMGVQVDFRDNLTVYSGSQFGNYSRQHLDTGGGIRIRPQHELGETPYRYNWLTPILLSRHNQDILYMASSRFHRSMNRGADMQTLSEDLTNGAVKGDVPFGTVATISESPLRFGLLYAGTDDGNVHTSSDAGSSWTALDLSSFPAVKGLWVTRVAASKHQEGRVYVTLNGYRNDHFSPYILMSNDYGKNWKSIAGNLPLEPVNVIEEDPKNDSILYAGTDGGIYVSKDAGQSWSMWNKGLPMAIPVHDIAIQERDNKIVLATHGRSLFIASLKEIQGK